ncbi:DUF1870 family protein [Pantoea sp. B65]|uniref:Aca2/YdiL-like domain-containing protein n=1 Tax=Pantoea sp. B65 TaxID=2813359 RepID=UPI0039B389B6
MNHLELQALRHIFFLSIEEAAQYLATDDDVSRWLRYEQGEEEITPLIIAKLSELLAQRKSRMNAIINKINSRIGNNTMKYFPSFEEFTRTYPDGDFLAWKTYQSVAAELYSRGLERLC